MNGKCVDGVMALKTKIPLKSSVLMLNIFQRTVTCEGWIMLCGVNFCTLSLIFIHFTDDLALALFFGSCLWLFIPVEWCSSPKVGRGGCGTSLACPIWFQMAVLLKCISCNRI